MFQQCCFQMDGIQMTTAIVIFVFCLLNALKEVGQMIQQVSLSLILCATLKASLIYYVMK